MTRGDTEYFTVGVEDDGVVVPLGVGDIIYLSVKRNIHQAEYLIHKKVEEFTDGKATIKIESADTRSLKFGTYVYDIQWTKANGDVKTIVRPSDFVVEGEVTNE